VFGGGEGEGWAERCVDVVFIIEVGVVNGRVCVGIMNRRMKKVRIKSVVCS